jgi:hypothetical protein
MLKHVFIAVAALLAAGTLFAAEDTSPALPSAGQEVRYDAATDRLSLDVKDRSLTDVLARISQQSDVEILIDPAVERPVTVSLQDQPLESVLGNLTRGMNAVMIHDERDLPVQGRQPVLVRMELLPKGQTNTALLRPVLSPEAEAMMRAKGRDPADSERRGFLNARREARLEHMDPARREKYEKRAAVQAEHQAKDQAARAERQAQHQQIRLEHLNARLAQAQALAATDPEGSQQRIQQINQKIARIQQGKATAASGSTP